MQLQELEFHSIKGTPSSLRQLFATEIPLKRMKNAFHFTLEVILGLKIVKFCLEFSIMLKTA